MNELRFEFRWVPVRARKVSEFEKSVKAVALSMRQSEVRRVRLGSGPFLKGCGFSRAVTSSNKSGFSR